MTIEETQERIRELEQDIEWGIGDKNASSELREAKRQLCDLECDAATLPGISLDRYNRYRAEQRHINRTIVSIAREIAIIRGKPIDRDFRLESIERYEPDNSDEDHLHVTFLRYFRCDAEAYEISFPISYLDDDWRSIEETKAETKKAADEAAEREKAETNRLAAQARDRAEYERLKTIYGEK